MFKKNAWIAGLIAALAILFAGCLPQPEAESTEGMEEVVIVDLQARLKGIPVGPLALNSADFKTVIDDSILKAAGLDASQSNVAFDVVADGLKVTQSGASWSGLDIDNRGASFRSGDVIKIEGYAATGVQVLLNLNHAGWDPLDGWNPVLDANAKFSKEFVLTPGDIGKIKGANPPAIRIRANGVGTAWVITQLTVTGLRGGGPVCNCVDTECPCKSTPGLMSEDCGPQCVHCVPAKFPAEGTATTYVAPTSTKANEFYLDLGALVSDTVTSDGPKTEQGVPVIAYKKDSVKFYFDRVDQRVSFQFSPAQKALIDAAVNGVEPFNVEIDAVATPDVIVRYGVINPTLGSNYNATDLPQQGVLSKSLKGKLTPSGNNKANDTHFTFQFREGGYLGVIVEIKSIKLIMPVVQIVDLTDLAVTAPIPGEKPQTAFSTAQYTGAITWYSDATLATAVTSNFVHSQNYWAKVELTTKNDFWKFAMGLSDIVGTFTIGDLKPETQTITAENKATVVFKFVALVANGTWPAGGNSGTDADSNTVNDSAFSIKPQIPATAPATGLVDVASGGKVALGTTVTATYTRGTALSTTGGVSTVVPAGPAEADLMIRWQMQTGTTWETKATGKTYKPADPGIWRIMISTPFYEPKTSVTFQVSSPALEGELDAALNNTYVKTAGATTVYSFTTWTPAATTPIANNAPFQNSGTATTVSYTTATGATSGGLNFMGRVNDYDCLALQITGNWSLTQAGSGGTTGSGGAGFDISTKKYKVIYYGVIVGTPPANTRAVIQLNGGSYTIFAQSDVITANEGSFKLEWEIPATLAAAGVRLATNNTAPYRITLVEVEYLGDR